VSPILIAVCLNLSSPPGEEKSIDFPLKSNVPPVTPGIRRTKNLGEQIDFFERLWHVQPMHS
jgi:hypothetical protein